MISLELLAIILMITGMVILGTTFILMKNSDKNTDMSLQELEFEKYQDELNETAISIYKELDEKYNEALVIYDIIEKKYSDLKSNNNSNSNFTEYSQPTQSTKYEIKNKNYETIKMQVITDDISREYGKKLETENPDNVAIKLLNDNILKENNNKQHTKQDEVRILLSKGFTTEQIAKELNIGIGEVQLIKELSKVKNEQT